MERNYVVVQGQVQGVGFRWFVKSLASRYEVTGWIRNMTNGLVEMELQGETAALNHVLHRIQKGDRFIQVTDLRCKSIALNLLEKDFTVRY